MAQMKGPQQHGLWWAIAWECIIIKEFLNEIINVKALGI